MKTIKKILPLSLLMAISGAVLGESESNHKIELIEGEFPIRSTPEKPVLGISSIRYDEKLNSLILLSDDTGTIRNQYWESGKARFYKLANSEWFDEKGNLNTSSFNLVEQVEIQPNDSVAWINHGHVDTESLAIADDLVSKGNSIGREGYFIASENGATYPVTFTNSSLSSYFPEFHRPEYFVQPKILHVNRAGELLGSYQFPEYYSDNAYSPDWLSNSLGWKKQGILRNKGIESLDRIKGTNNYIAITEGPLQQDSRVWKKTHKDVSENDIKYTCAEEDYGPAPSRLIEFSGDDLSYGSGKDQILPKGEYLYQHDDREIKEIVKQKMGVVDIKNIKNRKGITDVQVVNDKYALVLERNFISEKETGENKKYSATEVYKVKLRSSIDIAGSAEIHDGVFEYCGNKVLEKELLFRSTDYEGRNASFDTLNIEGLTFGPDFPDGSKLLILVNDNGANDEDAPNTYLIFFKVSKSLFND